MNLQFEFYKHTILNTMKIKFLLIAISCITLLLFTSCEKEEMGIGGTTGGGMQDANTISKSIVTPKENETIFVPDVILEAD